MEQNVPKNPEETPATSVPLASKEGAALVPPEQMTTLHERTLAMLSYISFFALIPFYLRKDSAFCRFHGKQGMLLAIFFFIAQLLAIIDAFSDLLYLLQVGIFFWMGFSALSGRWKKIPYVYNWACKLEEALSLKSKEEEEEEKHVRPDEVQ